MRDYIQMPHDRLVKVPEGFDMRVASFSELVSVSVQSISRFEKFANSNRRRIGIWGDGNVGFITALMLHYLYPNAELYIFGTVEDKLNFFTFAKETFHVDAVPEGVSIDHAFECVGGPGSRPAINQMIDLIEPEGSISLMGVSENFVDINTRMVLEKGLNLFGSSRSGRKDFLRTMQQDYENFRFIRCRFSQSIRRSDTTLRILSAMSSRFAISRISTRRSTPTI